MSTHNGETLRTPIVEIFWRQRVKATCFVLDVFFLEGLDEGLFLSFQISGNLWEIHGNTLIVLNPSWIIKTVKTCHGCSMLGLQFYPLALPKNVENGGVLGLCSCFLSSGLYLLGQPRRITGTTAMIGFAISVRFFPRRLVQVLEYARKHSWLTNLSNRERQKRSVRSRRRRWWKRRDSCLVLFLSCRTEWSHHDLFSHGQPGAPNTEK